MTVTTTTNRVQFDGDGSVVDFAFTFKVYETVDLEVVLTDSDGVETVQTITTHYSVALSGTPSGETGGTITMVTAPASGEKLTILRKLSQTQQVDLPVGGSFPSDVVEEIGDRGIMIIQQLQEELDRVIKFKVASTLSEIILPEGAGKGFRWNADLTALELVTIDEGSDPSLITTIGDLLQGGTSGAAERLASVARGDILRRGASKWEIVALGANGKVLLSNGTDVIWADVTKLKESGGQVLAIGSVVDGEFLKRSGTNLISAPGSRFKRLEFTRDTTLASGNQAVTGVGFQPTHVISIAAVNTVAGGSIGLADAVTSHVIGDDTKQTANSWTMQAMLVWNRQAANTTYYGIIATMDTDGFTMTWTKEGSPTGTLSVKCICFV